MQGPFILDSSFRAHTLLFEQFNPLGPRAVFLKTHFFAKFFVLSAANNNSFTIIEIQPYRAIHHPCILLPCEARGNHIYHVGDHKAMF